MHVMDLDEFKFWQYFALYDMKIHSAANWPLDCRCQLDAQKWLSLKMANSAMGNRTRFAI